MLQLELTDGGQIQRVLDRAAPDEIYNLAAQSFVHSSFEQPIHSGEVTGLAVARILEALRNSHATARFYQASTSELFGNARISPQDEETPSTRAAPMPSPSSMPITSRSITARPSVSMPAAGSCSI